jgi:hypothetical protein
LIHCEAGASRSPSIVLAYLIYDALVVYRDVKPQVFNNALDCVKYFTDFICQKRQIEPNSGFQRQLIRFASFCMILPDIMNFISHDVRIHKLLLMYYCDQ